MTRLRLVPTALAVMVSLLALQFVPRQTAGAVSCAGFGCTNQDPAATGCNQNARLMEQDTAYDGTKAIGYIQNWYSVSCQANWTVMQATATGYYVYNAAVRYCANSTCLGGSETLLDSYGAGDYIIAEYCPCFQGTMEQIPWHATRWYTNMVYSPNGTMTMSEGDFVSPSSGCYCPTVHVSNKTWH